MERVQEHSPASHSSIESSSVSQVLQWVNPRPMSSYAVHSYLSRCRQDSGQTAFLSSSGLTQASGGTDRLKVSECQEMQRRAASTVSLSVCVCVVCKRTSHALDPMLACASTGTRADPSWGVDLRQPQPSPTPRTPAQRHRVQTESAISKREQQPRNGGVSTHILRPRMASQSTGARRGGRHLSSCTFRLLARRRRSS